MNERPNRDARRTEPGTTPGTGPEGRASAEPARSAGPGRVWGLVVLLIVVPGLLYAAATAVPFMPFATATKLWLVPALVIAAEAVFWVAAVLFGREVISRYRRSLDPRNWFRRTDGD